MSDLLIELIPEMFVKYIGPLLLMLVGLAVEKHYTGRITFFTNAMALNLFFFGWPNLPIYVMLYVNLGLLVGLYSLGSYYWNHQESKEFYTMGGIFYSSISTAFVMLIAIGVSTGFIART